MRYLSLLLCLGLLSYGTFGSPANLDTNTADWVLSVICSEKGQLNLDPGQDQPICPETEGEGKKKPEPTFSLNPTSVDSIVDCTTRDDKEGICVLYYQCNPATKTVIEDGASIFDVRLNNCPHYLEVCCKRDDVEDDEEVNGGESESSRFNSETTAETTASTTTPMPRPGPTAPPTRPTAPLTRPTAPTTRPAEQPRPSTSKPPSKGSLAKKLRRFKRPNEGCGWSNPGVQVNLRSSEAGTETSPFANYGDFPWMTAILRKDSDDDIWSDGDYRGGGTMIHPSVVLTLAHKMKENDEMIPPKELRCRAGEWDTQTTFELFPHQERTVDRYIIHEDYYRRSLLNDIVLLILQTPFDLDQAPHMGTGCLATSLPSTDDHCFSMGWGRETNKKEKKLPSVLKKVKLNYVESKVCQDKLQRNSRLGPLFNVHESLICASGDDGVDTCRGDGGSPLVCKVRTPKNENRYLVYGMVCYGPVCANPEIPGLYTNIAHLKSWVDTKMTEEGFGTSSYTLQP